jgi:hypothetical protein
MEPLRNTTAPAVSSDADALFSALDQRAIGEGAGGWTAFVLAIHHDGRDRWVQVAAGPGGATKMVLRMSQWATVEHAAAALERGSPSTLCHPPVVDVMRPAT